MVERPTINDSMIIRNSPHSIKQFLWIEYFDSRLQSFLHSNFLSISLGTYCDLLPTTCPLTAILISAWQCFPQLTGIFFCSSFTIFAIANFGKVAPEPHDVSGHGSNQGMVDLQEQDLISAHPDFGPPSRWFWDQTMSKVRTSLSDFSLNTHFYCFFSIELLFFRFILFFRNDPSYIVLFVWKFSLPYVNLKLAHFRLLRFLSTIVRGPWNPKGLTIF